jgi:hypothetical protein
MAPILPHRRARRPARTAHGDVARRPGRRCAGYRDGVARVLLLVTGAVAAVVGAVVLATGAVFAATFGSDDRVATVPTGLAAQGSALVLDDLSVDAVGLPVPDDVGSLRLTAQAPDGSTVFLGVARTSDVDAYLVGAPYDAVVADLGGGTAQTRPVPGTQVPPAPAAQTFWLQSSQAAPAVLPAKVPAGTSVVIMKPDGSPGVAAQVSVALTLPGAWTASLIAIASGAVLLVLGVLLMVWGRRRGRRAPVGAHSAAAGAAAAPAAVDVLPGSGAAEPQPAPAADGPPADDPDPELAASDPADSDDGLTPEAAPGG